MRHKWIDDTCDRCGMTRKLCSATSVRGCFGMHRFERLMYRHANGREATSWDNPRKVPPCRGAVCPECRIVRGHLPTCSQAPR